MTGTLYYTPNSPYARVARVAARWANVGITEIEAQTRTEGTAYFDVSPLARVPYFEDGTLRLGETQDICRHFDRVGGIELFPEETDETRFLRHVAVGFLDGVAVWLRENGRPAGQRSDPVMHYEEHRAEQALAWLEARWMVAAPRSYTRLVLACTCDIAQSRGMAAGWAEIAPTLIAHAGAIAVDPAMKETAPLPL